MRNQAKGNGSHTCDHIITISLVWHVLHFFTYGRMDGNYCESLHRNPGTLQKIGRPEEVDNLISMEFLRQVSTHMCRLPKTKHTCCTTQHTMQKTFFPLQNSIIIANKSSFSEYVGHSPAAAVLFAEIIKFAVPLFQNAVLAKLS